MAKKAALVLVVGLLVVVALSSAISGAEAQNATSPLWPHLAFTTNEKDISVSYYSTGAARFAGAKWGTASNNYPHRASGTSRTYEASVGYCHDVVVTDIEPAQKYYYRVGSDADGWSQEFSFKLSHLTPPTPIQPAVIPIFGDMGILHSEHTIAQLVKLRDVDFFYHVGDISYADDRESRLYQTVWNAWFHNMSEILPYKPYMVLPGNHEAHSGKEVLSWSEKFNVFNYRFNMPNSDKTKNNMWYSFNYRNIHFVSISTETDFPGCEFHTYNFGDQLAWLEKDLAEAHSQRKERPWIIVSGHRPLYSSASSKYIQDMLPPVQKAFEDMFHKYKVDIFFCGHVHAYERTYPVYKNKATSKHYTNPEGPVVITTGAAGDIEGISRDWLNPRPEWSALHYDKTTGYGILRVDSNSKLRWTFYNSETNALVDHIEITNTHKKL